MDGLSREVTLIKTVFASEKGLLLNESIYLECKQILSF